MNTLKFIVFLLTISACSLIRHDREEPMRVNGVPDKAFWVGGNDGGNWYLVENVHSHRNNASIKVYNDTDGSLIVSKRFSLICPTDNVAYIEDLQKQISGFDGERILLKSTNGKKACFLQ